MRSRYPRLVIAGLKRWGREDDRLPGTHLCMAWKGAFNSPLQKRPGLYRFGLALVSCRPALL